MTVREIVPADAGEIGRVHVDTWRNTYAGIWPNHVFLRISKDQRKVGWNGALFRGVGTLVSANPTDRIVYF